MIKALEKIAEDWEWLATMKGEASITQPDGPEYSDVRAADAFRLRACASELREVIQENEK